MQLHLRSCDCLEYGKMWQQWQNVSSIVVYCERAKYVCSVQLDTFHKLLFLILFQDFCHRTVLLQANFKSNFVLLLCEGQKKFVNHFFVSDAQVKHRLSEENEKYFWL